VKQKPNLFYLLVVLVGILFVITTLGYVVTLVRQQRAMDLGLTVRDAGEVPHFLEEHGGSILLWEAGILTLCSLLAMALDRWRSRR